MAIEKDKSQALIKQKQSKLLEAYEGKIQSLLQEKIDKRIDDENYTFKQEDLRRVFLHEFENITKEIDLSTTESKFKNIIMEAHLNQVKRGFGCIEAIQTLKPLVSQYNNQIGEQVINITTKQTLSFIEKIEKIKLVCQIMEAVDLPKEVNSKILSNLVDREFQLKHFTETKTHK